MLRGVGMNRIHGTCPREKAGVAMPEALAGGVGAPCVPRLWLLQGQKVQVGRVGKGDKFQVTLTLVLGGGQIALFLDHTLPINC